VSTCRNINFPREMWRRARENHKYLYKYSLWGTECYPNKKLSGRSGCGIHFSAPGWQAGQVWANICRVRDEEGSWAGHLENQEVS
jgi:hypothetical protein